MFGFTYKFILIIYAMLTLDLIVHVLGFHLQLFLQLSYTIAISAKPELSLGITTCESALSKLCSKMLINEYEQYYVAFNRVVPH